MSRGCTEVSLHGLLDTSKDGNLAVSFIALGLSPEIVYKSESVASVSGWNIF